MIDTSDGLSTDLAHLCEESGVGAELDAALIPRARVGKPAREVDLDLALHGGEDYELLFTAAARQARSRADCRSRRDPDWRRHAPPKISCATRKVWPTNCSRGAGSISGDNLM